MLDQECAVIVMGLGPSGLFLTRQLSRITKKIYAIGRNDDVGMYSKYIKKENRYWASKKEDVLCALSKILECEGKKPLLYISSDQYLTLLLDLGEQILQYVELSGSGLDTLRMINDKECTLEFCRKHNIQIPDSFGFVEFEKMKSKTYPVIIKWNEKVLRAGKNPIGKVKICEDSTAFSVLSEQIKKADVELSSIHVQTYIEGDNGCQYSVGGYYQNGVPLANIVVNQIRQYPQGISAMVLSTQNKITTQLEELSSIFAQSIGFTGFLEMEYKVDAKTNVPYLLDINPRPWGWISALGIAYKDFYKVLLGQKPCCERKPVLWKSPLRNFLSRKNKKNVPIGQDISEYECACDISDQNDKMPSVMIYWMMIKKIIRK